MNAFLCQLQISSTEYTGINVQIKRKNMHVCVDLYLLSDYNQIDFSGEIDVLTAGGNLWKAELFCRRQSCAEIW